MMFKAGPVWTSDKLFWTDGVATFDAVSLSHNTGQLVSIQHPEQLWF